MQIKSIYAWVMTQANGEERVFAVAMIPLVSPSQKAAEGFRDLAQKAADEQGLPIDLVRFSSRETIQRVRKGGSTPVPLKKEGRG